mmetsp:Transcript_35603/g.89464  ORF Transcript_35603/g.89464 Transcript_35603/m.89464 type:complete len:275 (-) Transcript_35603:29-853(-)
MPTQHLAGLVRVHAALVVHKVSVDREGSLHGPPLHELGLDLRNVVAILANVAAVVSLVPCGDGAGGVTGGVVAGGLALGRVHEVQTGLLVGGASGDVVRLALVGGHARVLQILPSTLEITALAARVELVTRHHVGRRKDGVLGLVTGDAPAVGESLHGTKGPAAAALGLVADHGKTLAARPGSPGVERRGECVGLNRPPHDGDALVHAAHLCAHQPLDLVKRLTLEDGVLPRLPRGGRVGVHFLDELIVDVCKRTGAEAQNKQDSKPSHHCHPI